MRKVCEPVASSENSGCEREKTRHGEPRRIASGRADRWHVRNGPSKTAPISKKENCFCDRHRGTVPAREREPMITYCILCRAEIPEKRARRGAITCSPDHQQEYRRQRRSERALKFCRLCGRKARRPKVVASVLQEHSAIGEQA